MSRMPAVKNVGEPCAGEQHAWRREETRSVGPARAARSRRLPPTLQRQPDASGESDHPRTTTGAIAMPRRRSWKRATPLEQSSSGEFPTTASIRRSGRPPPLLQAWQSHSDAGAPARVKAVVARRARARLDVGDCDSAQGACWPLQGRRSASAVATASSTSAAHLGSCQSATARRSASARGLRRRGAFGDWRNVGKAALWGGALALPLARYSSGSRAQASNVRSGSLDVLRRSRRQLACQPVAPSVAINSARVCAWIPRRSRSA